MVLPSDKVAVAAPPAETAGMARLAGALFERAMELDRRARSALAAGDVVKLPWLMAAGA